MTLSHGANIVTDNLILMLDAANPRSYPGSGTAWKDLSGNGNNGTLVNSPTYSNTNLGGITFNGTSQYVTTPLVQTSVTAYTISVWFLTSSNTQSMTMVGDRGSGAGVSVVVGIGGALGYGGNSGNLFVCVNSDSYIVPIYTPAAYNDAKWHNVVGVFNQPSGTITYSSLTLYVDGQLATTTNGTSLGSTSSPITGLGGTIIGISSAAAPGTYYTGLMSAVLIYNAALTAAQVAQNFETYRGRYGV